MQLKITLFLFLLSYSISLSAQLNASVGYNLGLFNAPQHDALLQEYNAERDWLNKGLNNLRTTNGIILGVRQRFDFVSLEFAWKSNFSRTTADGTEPTSNANFERFLTYRHTVYSLGLGLHFDKVTLGATIDRNDFRFKWDGTGITNPLVASTDKYYSNQFYVSYEFEGNEVMSVAIRPYYQLTWSSFDLGGLGDQLEISNSADKSFNTSNFGLQIIFYNGKHY